MGLRKAEIFHHRQTLVGLWIITNERREVFSKGKKMLSTGSATTPLFHFFFNEMIDQIRI